MKEFWCQKCSSHSRVLSDTIGPTGEVCGQHPHYTLWPGSSPSQWEFVSWVKKNEMCSMHKIKRQNSGVENQHRPEKVGIV